MTGAVVTPQPEDPPQSFEARLAFAATQAKDFLEPEMARRRVEALERLKLTEETFAELDAQDPRHNLVHRDPLHIGNLVNQLSVKILSAIHRRAVSYSEEKVVELLVQAQNLLIKTIQAPDSQTRDKERAEIQFAASVLCQKGFGIPSEKLTEYCAAMDRVASFKSSASKGP